MQDVTDNGDASELPKDKFPDLYDIKIDVPYEEMPGYVGRCVVSYRVRSLKTNFVCTNHNGFAGLIFDLHGEITCSDELVFIMCDFGYQTGRGGYA